GLRGLGAAAYRALGANGVKLAVNGRDRSAIESVVGEIGEAGDARFPHPRIARTARRCAASDRQDFLPGMTSRRAGSIITMASAGARMPGGAPIAYAGRCRVPVTLAHSGSLALSAGGSRGPCSARIGHVALDEHRAG